MSQPSVNSAPSVLLIVTLDTKETEALFIKECLEGEGVNVLIMNPSIRGAEHHEAAVGPQEIAMTAGTTLEQVRNLGHEGKSLHFMITGAIACAQQLYQQGKFDGVISLGGSMGTTLGCMVMQSLPLGVPKLMISTMASGMTKPFVGTKDIMMLHSVADISGLNGVTRSVFSTGANAIAGAVKGKKLSTLTDKPRVLISTLGTTDACVRAVREQLDHAGYETIVFHTNGTGGKAMDEMVAQLDVAAVLDLSLIEISDHVYGGYFDGGEDRGKASINRKVPTIFVPGNIDFLVAGPIDDARSRFPGKKYHEHNAAVTAVRAGREEFERMAEHFSSIWNNAEGVVQVFIPLGGFSAHDSPEGNLYEPELPAYFERALKQSLRADIPVQTMDCHINAPAFSTALVDAIKNITANPNG